MKIMRRSILILLLSATLAGCNTSEPDTPSATPSAESQQRPKAEAVVASPPIVAAARSQVGKTTVYDPAYVSLDYPGGDVPIDRGVCTDVLIRALRDSLDMDLQRLLHQDMKRAFSTYPKIWGLKKPDRNIDHRRVPNLRAYFERKGYSVDVSQKCKDYLPGDIVTCTVGGTRPHIMVVSDRKTTSGEPLVIHNIGRGTKEERHLFSFPITGHYRIKTEESANEKLKATVGTAP
jgi:uncharacterized protein YijF (DUF1287 family)